MRRSAAWLGLLLATSGFVSASVPHGHSLDLSVSNTNAPMLLAATGHTIIVERRGGSGCVSQSVAKTAADATVISDGKIGISHQVEDAPFEAVQVAYLLANRCAVVAEGDPMQDDDARPWAEGMAWTSYDNLLATCQHWLAETSQRQQLADQGYQLIQRRPEARYLESVLNQMATDHVL